MVLVLSQVSCPHFRSAVRKRSRNHVIQKIVQAKKWYTLIPISRRTSKSGIPLSSLETRRQNWGKQIAQFWTGLNFGRKPAVTGHGTYRILPSLTVWRESGSERSLATRFNCLFTTGSVMFSTALFSRRMLFWNGVSRKLIGLSSWTLGLRQNASHGRHSSSSKVLEIKTFFLSWMMTSLLLFLHLLRYHISLARYVKPEIYDHFAIGAERLVLIAGANRACTTYGCHVVLQMIHSKKTNMTCASGKASPGSWSSYKPTSIRLEQKNKGVNVTFALRFPFFGSLCLVFIFLGCCRSGRSLTLILHKVDRQHKRPMFDK